MRKITQILLIIGLPLLAQDITNKLGASGNYDITDPSDNLIVRVQNDGKVGMGTDSPALKLHICSDDVQGLLILDRTANSSINDQARIGIDNNGSDDYLWIGRFSTHRDFIFNIDNGRMGIGTLTPNGALDVNGSIYQRGGVLHADYVFEDDYELESIQEHSDYMWRNKHLPAIPKAKFDDAGNEIVEVGSHRRGIVEELEKAHIYIAQLEERISKLERILTKKD